MRLRELRIKSCLTQKKLAEMMNVSSQSILNWENGIFEPNLTQIVQLADIFSVTVDYLLEHDVKLTKADEVCFELEKITHEEFVAFIKKCLEFCDKEGYKCLKG